MLTLAMARYHPQFSERQGYWHRLACAALQPGDHDGDWSDLRHGASWATARTGLSETLKERRVEFDHRSRARRRLRNALVVCEMALALVLLTGAGLLVRTFVELVNVDLGIDPKNVVTMGSACPITSMGLRCDRRSSTGTYCSRSRTSPGVKAAGVERRRLQCFFPTARPAAGIARTRTDCELHNRDAGFFEGDGNTPGGRTRVHRARQRGATPVALISETVAHRYWPHSSPLGSHLTVLARVYSGQRSGSSQPLEIVGVVKDVRNEDLWRPEPAIYVPFAQKPVPSVFLVVRAAVPPMSIVPACAMPSCRSTRSSP